jgi:hypothetical protein
MGIHNLLRWEIGFEPELSGVHRFTIENDQKQGGVLVKFCR